jgi:hypothetical protein
MYVFHAYFAAWLWQCDGGNVRDTSSAEVTGGPLGQQLSAALSAEADGRMDAHERASCMCNLRMTPFPRPTPMSISIFMFICMSMYLFLLAFVGCLIVHGDAV